MRCGGRARPPPQSCMSSACAQGHSLGGRHTRRRAGAALQNNSGNSCSTSALAFSTSCESTLSGCTHVVQECLRRFHCRARPLSAWGPPAAGIAGGGDGKLLAQRHVPPLACVSSAANGCCRVSLCRVVCVCVRRAPTPEYSAQDRDSQLICAGIDLARRAQQVVLFGRHACFAWFSVVDVWLNTSVIAQLPRAASRRILSTCAPGDIR